MLVILLQFLLHFFFTTGHLLGFFQFLGAFAKFRKATVNFVKSVRVEPPHSHWTDFNEILYLISFRKSVGKIQFH